MRHLPKPVGGQVSRIYHVSGHMLVGCKIRFRTASWRSKNYETSHQKHSEEFTGCVRKSYFTEADGQICGSNRYRLRSRETTPFELTLKKSLCRVFCENTKYEPVPALRISSRASPSVSTQPSRSGPLSLTAKTSKGTSMGTR